MENGKILIVIPAFNEQNNIAAVIRDIRAALPHSDILVINDCSHDRTADRARAFPDVRVVDLPYNLGIGGAVQTGFKYAAAKGYEYMVQIDGDGQHIPREVAKLVGAMESSSADMVIGSRFLDIRSYRTTWPRRAGIRIFSALFRLLINTRISDGTSGFRLYNAKSIALLARYYSSDYPEPDAVILLKKHGLKIREVGVEMRPRAHGASSITPMKSPYYMAKVILSLVFSATRTTRG